MKEEIENVFCENLFEWPWLDSGLSEHHTHTRTPNAHTHIYTMHTRVLQKAIEVEIDLEPYILISDLVHSSQKASEEVSRCLIKLNTFALKFEAVTYIKFKINFKISKFS